jgi:hypothetical protein
MGLNKKVEYNGSIRYSVMQMKFKQTPVAELGSGIASVRTSTGAAGYMVMAMTCLLHSSDLANKSEGVGLQYLTSMSDNSVVRHRSQIHSPTTFFTFFVRRFEDNIEEELANHMLMGHSFDKMTVMAKAILQTRRSI